MREVLIICKESALRKNAVGYLTEKGYRVFALSDSYEGLKTAIERKPDVIVTGSPMEGLHTYDIIRTIRKDSKLAATPVICLIESFDKTEFRRAMEAGADDTLIMPFDIETLNKSIETRYRRIMEITDYPKITSKTKYPSEREFVGENKHWIFIDTKQIKKFIKIESIKYISAAGVMTVLFLEDGEKIELRKSVSEWERRLDKNNFVRVNRSTVLNLNYIENIGQWSSRTIIVRLYGMDEPLIISQRYSKKLKHLLK